MRAMATATLAAAWPSSPLNHVWYALLPSSRMYSWSWIRMDWMVTYELPVLQGAVHMTYSVLMFPGTNDSDGPKKGLRMQAFALGARWLTGRVLAWPVLPADRKSTRLNSSHLVISYAVFCLKKKNQSPMHPSSLPSLNTLYIERPTRRHRTTRNEFIQTMPQYPSRGITCPESSQP